MIIGIQATNADITAEEITKALPPAARAALNGKKAVAYVIAEEGESRPRVIGEGTQVLKWPRAVIKRVAESVDKGTKFFERHNADSSHENRKALGEVIGTFTRVVGDKLQAIAVGLLYGERPDLDVCSIEADVRVAGDMVGDVESVTGVALSSSKVDSPAFPGARRLATLQCFNEPSDKDDSNKDKAGENGHPEREKKMATFEEVKQFIRDHNVFPRQLFTLDDLKGDREFGPILDTGAKAVTEKTALETRIKELEKGSSDAVRKMEVDAAKGRFEKLIPEGATDKQKAFYLRRFDAAKMEKLDDAALKAHLENEAKEFAEYAKMLGAAAESSPSNDKSGEQTNDKSSTDADPVAAALKETTGGK